MNSLAQRQELQNKIWKIANDVRGSVDGWDFKQFVLDTLFYRFISENFRHNLIMRFFFTVEKTNKLRTDIDSIINEIEA